MGVYRLLHFGCFCALALSSELARAQTEPLGAPVTVIVTGDAMAPMRLKETAFRLGSPRLNYFGTLLESIRKIVAPADIAFVNLETPISATEPVKPRPFVFNAPADYLKALKWLGFDVLSVANNHSLDQKALGLAETVAAIEHEGMLPVGAAGDRETALAGRVVEARGLRVGFLAFTAFINGGNAPGLALQSPYLNFVERTKDLNEAIDKMKSRADVIILSLHWGTEYEPQPQAWQTALASRLHDRGVDVIVGHHPHVLQPVHYHKGKTGRSLLTMYSLGNLISNQEAAFSSRSRAQHDGRTRDGALVELHLSKTGVSAFRVHPLWTDNWSGPEDGIRTVRIRDEVNKLTKKIDRLRLSPERTFLLERRQLLIHRYDRVYKSLGLKVPSLAPAAAPTN